MSFFQLLAKRVFWRHVILMGVVTFLLIILIQLFLYLFTFHNQKIELPDFRGLTLDEIQTRPNFNHFTFEITDSIYDNEKKPGTIVSQNPTPGSFVKKGRKIYVTIISKTPEMVRLPNLLDLTLRESRAILQTHGLQVGKVKYVPDIGRTVIKAIYEGKEIPWGTLVPKGSTIDLVVGNGNESESNTALVTVPKLIGLTKEQVENNIRTSGLILGKETYLSKQKTKKKPRVVKQDPPAFSEVEYGTEIQLWYE